MVSISKVEVSEDSSYATFFITALEKPELALEFMKSKEQELQRQMSKLRRRKIPLLRFRVDTQAEEAEKLERLLRKLE
jgi:ribosome-binding factor A